MTTPPTPRPEGERATCGVMWDIGMWCELPPHGDDTQHAMGIYVQRIAPAAQPDEAAELVEKCARVLCDIDLDGANEARCTNHDKWADTMYHCPDGTRDARAAVSVLAPAIREQHGEQIAREARIAAEQQHNPAAMDALSRFAATIEGQTRG